MSILKTAIRWMKSVLTGLFVVAVMVGTLFVVPGFEGTRVARFLSLTGEIESQAKSGGVAAMKGMATMAGTENMEGMETASTASAPDADAKEPTRRVPVQLNVTKQQLIGVSSSVVDYRPLAKSIRTVGIVTYDETGITDINLKVSGWIEKLFVDYMGKAVSKGQPLLTLYSPDLVTTQEEYLLALRTREKVANSRLADAVAGADALVAASRRRLRLWDISERQIRELVRTGKPKTYMTIESPAAGVVIQKTAVEKMFVKPGMSLYRIADISSVWINADIYEYEMPFVRVGQAATITLPYDGGRRLEGRITFIDPFLNPRTRTGTVRFSFDNPGLALRPDTYVNVEIRVDAGMKLAVPESAVMHTGKRQLVFLNKGKGLFEARNVRLGANIDGHYVVLEGLSPGDKVVTAANFLLDSESQLMAATGGMKGMMSLIGMGDAPMEGASMGDMDGMEGMDDMGDMKEMEGMDDMDPAGGMEGMEGMDGMGNMKEMEGMEGMELAGGMRGMEGMEAQK